MRPALQRIEDRKSARPDYRFDLGGKAILSLLAAFLITCGMFFVFGYTMGKHAIPATFQLGSAPPAAPKPPVQATPPAPVTAPVDAGQPAPDPNAPVTPPSQPTAADGSSPAPVAADPLAPAAVGPYRVQVLIGSKTDADSMSFALRAKGYPAAVAPPNPGENELSYRVQVGPFASQEDADITRSRLATDGYTNATVVKLQ